MQNKLKLWQPHLIALGLFILIPVMYFWPALQGKTLAQSDITNFLGVSKEIFDFRSRFHHEPLWTNSMFGGMPSYQISAYYAADLMMYIFQIIVAILPFPISTVFISCLSFYVLMKVMKVDSWVAIIGSFGYAFSSFFFIILTAGHNSEANACSFMPLVLAGVIMAFNGKRLAGTVLTAFAMAMELFASHLQITYYLFMAIAVYAVARLVTAIKEKQLVSYLKTAAMLAVATMLAFGTNLTSLWLTYEYSKYSSRGKSELTLNHENKSSGLTKEYATGWCYGVGESFTLLIPDFKGGASDPIGSVAGTPRDLDEQQTQIYQNYSQYFGDQPFTSGPVYVGAIICFFALMGMFLIKGSLKWFLLVTTALSIALSWGHNPVIIFGTSIFDFFFDHFPAFNNFRAVSMILVLAELTLPIMAALALDRIVNAKDFLNESIPVKFIKNMSGKKILFISLGIVGGFALLCYITPTSFTDFQNQSQNTEWVQRFVEGAKASQAQAEQYLGNVFSAVAEARKKIFTGDAGRTLIFIVLSAALVWVYSKKMISRNWFAGVLCFFVLWDLSQVDWRYLDHSREHWTTKKAAQVPYQPEQADIDIQKDTSLDYRVYNTTVRPDQDSRTSYFHKSIGGYSGVKMKRFDEMLQYTGLLSTRISRENIGVLNMLNTKYIIAPGPGGKENVAEKNPDALGNAWFVNNWKIVEDADSEIISLSHFDPKHTALVDKRFTDYLKGITPTNDSTGSIKMKSYQPNDLVYESKSNVQELAVFSEVYYKEGWDAFIDGKPSDYIRANYVLRAMIIPAGNHTIEFKFEPKSYAIGEKISLASSLIILLSCVGILFMEFRKKPTE
ncbi:MAG TPA: hypothetical protein VK783_04270 [Bacteroidia bacterium]|nr:hypothetical protein [Bacteroidia bacterium]